VYLRREGRKRDDVFSCLRGWSSAVTLLEGGQDTQWKGGGYFLKWRGRGIVIDPGFDFLDNFHDAGYNGREIDAVLVSHNHPDHNYDLGSVDDLRYELHRRWKVMAKAERKDLDLGKCLFVIDEDTAKAFKHDSPDHRRMPMKFDLADFEHKRWLEGTNGLPLNIEHFPVSHGEDVPCAVGMKLRLLGADGKTVLVIGYTGDTEYSDRLADSLKGCDILLAHISMPDPEEYTNENHFKKRHLGYNGMAKLIERTKPRLTLMGEFWAGLADLRIDLTQSLRQRTKNAAILPTGVGFHLHLPSIEVECTCCQKLIACTRVRVAPASTPFGTLGYLCELCLV
jgi:ribonuclease BN (tRNA processing enzyme)